MASRESDQMRLIKGQLAYLTPDEKQLLLVDWECVGRVYKQGEQQPPFTTFEDLVNAYKATSELTPDEIKHYIRDFGDHTTFRSDRIRANYLSVVKFVREYEGEAAEAMPAWAN